MANNEQFITLVHEKENVNISLNFSAMTLETSTMFLHVVKILYLKWGLTNCKKW